MDPIFTKTLRKTDKSNKVYKLDQEEVKEILDLRGMKTELDPGMGGVSPKVIQDLMKTDSELVSVDLALLSGCNFKCIWCYRPGEEWGKMLLDFNKVKEIVEQSLELGVRFFVITGGEPLMYLSQGKNYFDVVDLILSAYKKAGKEVNVLTFTDVALIDEKKAKMLAERKVALCLKRDTLNYETQDLIVGEEFGVKFGSKKMDEGYRNLFEAGYGKNPDLAVSVNSVLAKGVITKTKREVDTLSTAIDLHMWVRSNGMEHSIVPIHYCGEAEEEKQEEGINPLHVKALYDILAQIDQWEFNDKWAVFSAFPKNKTCNRPGRGVHIRATGKVTSCSESPLVKEYIFGDINKDNFKDVIRSSKFNEFKEEFANREGDYICNPDVCDLNDNHLCRGGCATRSAFSRIDPETGLIKKQTNPLAYSKGREDPLCPAWIVLAQKQGVLKPGVYENVVDELLKKSNLSEDLQKRIRSKVVKDFQDLRGE